tara:strand:- start:8449 stop:11679 length:3231 start_codon:yes stop_codon:yes gene_type:complete
MAKRNWKNIRGPKRKRVQPIAKKPMQSGGVFDQFTSGIKNYTQQGVDAFKANPGGMIGTAAGAVGQLMAQRQLKNSSTAEDALRNDASQRKSAATSGLATGFAAGMNSGVGKALGKLGPLGKLAQGAVGAFGAIRGKNLAKTQQERDRKEAVGQLRIKQNAELKAQKAGASSFDAGPMGRTGFGSATSATRKEDQRMQRGGVKNEAVADPEVGKKVAGEKSPSEKAQLKNKEHGAALRDSFNSLGVVGGLKKVLTRPEPENSMWHNFPSYFTGKDKKQTGGVKQLRGGNMTKLPGGAVQFNGAKHSQGGIDLDKNTEVEGGETMDKVSMKKKGGKAKDYIFSEYLKLGGRSFAQRHKEILNRGGKQSEIQNLAKLQERSAAADGEKDRGSDRIMKNGGERRKYQTGDAVEGGEETTESTTTTRTASLFESIKDFEDFKNSVNLPDGHPAKGNEEALKKLWTTVVKKIGTARMGDGISVDDDAAIKDIITGVTSEGVADQNAAAKQAWEEEQERVKGENERITAEREERSEAGSTEIKEDGERVFGGSERGVTSILERLSKAQEKFPDDVPDFDFDRYRNADGEFDESLFDNEARAEFIKHNNENVPEDLRSTMLSTEGKLNQYGQNTDYIVGDQWNRMDWFEREATPNAELEYKELTADITPKEVEETEAPEETPTDDSGGSTPTIPKKPDVPFGAYLGGLAQLIPPAYAFRNPPATVQAPGAESVQPGRLHRVNYNAERAANAGDFRATQQAIENNASGPGGMVNLVAALSKKQQGDLKLANAESEVNKSLASEEAKMSQQASTTNATLGLEAGQYAAGLAREQIKDRREEKLGALDAAADRIAGITGDVLDYKGQERMARAIGRDGVYTREQLMEMGYSAEDAANLVNKMNANKTQGGEGASGTGSVAATAKLSKKQLRENIDAKMESGEELTEAEQKIRNKDIKKAGKRLGRETRREEKREERKERNAIAREAAKNPDTRTGAEKLKDRKAEKAKKNRSDWSVKYDIDKEIEDAREVWSDEDRAKQEAVKAAFKKRQDEKYAAEDAAKDAEKKRGGYFRGRRKIIRKKRKIKR